MKKVLVFILSFCMAFAVCIFEADAIGTSAQAFVLMDADTGLVLAGSNENEKLKMASTTKIMTTLIALQEAEKKDRVVTFTENMIAEGSSMYLKIGDKLRLSDLAAGMMMASGNDAANATALSISKSFEDFAELMNKRAEQIGMTNTNFVTPSGLDDEEHFSTAYDMALLMSEAINNESFASLTSCTEKTVEFVYPEDKVTTYQNHNKLLKLYKNCTGGKTGYTDAAGRCLVTCAEKDGVRLVAVTLNAPDDWNDHQALYEYGFSLYTGITLNNPAESFSVKVSGGKQDFVLAGTDKAVTVSIPANRAKDIKTTTYLPGFLFAPVKKGETLGEITYTLDGVELMKTEIKATETVDEIHQPNFWERLLSVIFNRE